MKELFVTHQIAKDLKELSYDGECLTKFIKTGKLKYHPACLSGVTSFNSKIIGDACAAPLWQQAIDWFDEEHNISIEIERWYSAGYQLYIYSQYGRKQYYTNDGKSMFKSRYDAKKQGVIKAIEILKLIKSEVN